MAHFFEILINNYETFVITGAIMVSAIIVFIGFLKLAVINKVSSKPLRKSLLALSVAVISFATMAVWFLIKHYDFSLYWQCSVGLFLACIVVYWFYENTHLRDVIHRIGVFTIKKFASVLLLAFSDDTKKNIEAEFKRVESEVKTATKNELCTEVKKITKDRELEKL